MLYDKYTQEFSLIFSKDLNEKCLFGLMMRSKCNFDLVLYSWDSSGFKSFTEPTNSECCELNRQNRILKVYLFTTSANTSVQITIWALSGCSKSKHLGMMTQLTPRSCFANVSSLMLPHHHRCGCPVHCIWSPKHIFVMISCKILLDFF